MDIQGILGIDSDVLYPPHELQALADGLPNGDLFWLRSPILIGRFSIACEVARSPATSERATFSSSLRKY